MKVHDRPAGASPGRRRRARFAAIGLVALLAPVLFAGCEPGPSTLHVTTVVSGLDHPWGIAFAPDGTMVFTERPGRFRVRLANGTVRQLSADLSDLYVSGEAGLLDVALPPDFASNRQVYACYAYHVAGGSLGVRVVRWTVDAGWTRLDNKTAVVNGMPLVYGRHAGCRLAFRPTNPRELFIGTGDAAVGTNPQDLTSLGGKVLRVDAITGRGLPGNPFYGDPNGNKARVWSWGHRNVQGLTFRPSGRLWSVEQGTYRDDEVNTGSAGNYGYDPVPGYNETVPMTDLSKFPNAVPARWSSGNPTLATSGADWLSGAKWKGWDDTLAVGALKAQELLIMRFDSSGNLIGQPEVPAALHGTYGRLRTPVLGPDGDLYLTTDNGSGTDRILRIAPG